MICSTCLHSVERHVYFYDYCRDCIEEEGAAHWEHFPCPRMHELVDNLTYIERLAQKRTLL